MSDTRDVSQSLVSSTSDLSSATRSLNSQVVLEEDEYTAAISHIIARDFFPSLVHLDATNNYLDALRSDDPGLLNASVRRLRELATPSTTMHMQQSLQTPSQTPWGGDLTDTPFSVVERPKKRPRYDINMSLDNFQARYTSEDNSSFTDIMEEDNRLRREKWAWAWDAQKRVEAQTGKMVESREKLLIEPASSAPGVTEKLRIEVPESAGLITGKEDSDSVVEVTQSDVANKDTSLSIQDKVNDSIEFVDVMAKKKDTRSAAVDSWKFKNRNALMFPPDADTLPYNTATSTTTKGPPKVIIRDNTRLPEQDDYVSDKRGLSMPPSPTRSRVEAAITGTPYHPKSPKGSFSLLPTIPSPTPSELGPAGIKQLMTWGTLNATPRVISTSDDPADMGTPSMPFHLPAPSSREVIGMKLSNKAGKSIREKAILMAGGSGNANRRAIATGRSPSSLMPPPTWTPRRADAAGSLTPAGKRLLNRTTTGVASTRRADVMGKTAGWESSSKAKERDMQRVRWTPSPSPVTGKRI